MLVDHLRRGLQMLESLPKTPERLQYELELQTSLGQVLLVARSYSAPEVGQAFARARELCQQLAWIPTLGKRPNTTSV